ncbi:MAG: class IIb bacteriocin, lactobin A/cerein 7B family [Mesorhizobium sp.]|uniref:class IIb bacteriocin, lactobin A/cerein 7B family n=1 Tax=Mesorhizobium sp. TaxID=1871066 RepID=UPI000FE2D121|nr:MAG: class IIb bacteriocin, lactobin A/cerein 7B family [Mesorhizobium sp.]RWJ11928.1 MAG: class IIb bacteriocin, lactobin A/cerein 7B family [Mesorhizobium sp.]
MQKEQKVSSIREIDSRELDQVSGGILPIVAGAVWGAAHIGLALYTRLHCK